MAERTSTLSWRSDAHLCAAPADFAERITELLIANKACYSAALILAGKPVWAERHARRLKRDALALGLGEVVEEEVLLALTELGRAAFENRGSDGDGIVRVTAFRGETGVLELFALPAELAVDPDQWRAVLAPFAHDTHGRVWTGAKGSNLPLYNRARALMAEKGMQEVLLVDADDCVIEGCRSNIFVVDADGALVAPNLSRGAVAGIAQELVHEHIREVVIRDMKSTELAGAREIIAVSSVSRAGSIVQLDGKPVGSGAPGPWHRRILELLASAP